MKMQSALYVSLGEYLGVRNPDMPCRVTDDDWQNAYDDGENESNFHNYQTTADYSFKYGENEDEG